MEIRPFTSADRDAFAAIRLELFPEDDVDDWAVDHHLSPGAVAFGAFDPDLVGYAAADLRSHAEGAWERPPGEQRIAYLEEWYVRPDSRGRGVGRALVDAVRQWARDLRATHLASDAEIDNRRSIAAHLALGFEEVERSVHFVEVLESAEARPVAAGDEIELREVDNAVGTEMMRLRVAPAQRHFVADNMNSLARAFLNDGTWVRAVYAGDQPVGFVMLSTKESRWSLWRFMIDHRYQGRGYGARAMELVIEHVRAAGGDRLWTSYVPAPGGPRPFYRKLGFVETGKSGDWEVEAYLEL